MKEKQADSKVRHSQCVVFLQKIRVGVFTGRDVKNYHKAAVLKTKGSQCRDGYHIGGTEN